MCGLQRLQELGIVRVEREIMLLGRVLVSAGTR